MPYIPFTDEQKVIANSVDLEYFLRSRGETLEKVGREYKLIYSDGNGRHDSITMSGSTWFDHKNQTGGGAIKFMQYFHVACTQHYRSFVSDYGKNTLCSNSSVLAAVDKGNRRRRILGCKRGEIQKDSQVQ